MIALYNFLTVMGVGGCCKNITRKNKYGHGGCTKVVI